MRNRALAALAALLCPGAVPARAQDVAGFYADKTITLNVAAGPGGGYDLYARALARHMGKYIPGAPSIAIQYMPGGGGLVAANNLYGAAKRDGASMAMLASSVFLLASLGDPQARFENLKFTPVGNMNEESDTCSFWHTTGIRSIGDLRARDAVIGTTGVGSNSHTFPLGMNAVIGTRFRAVLGYPGAGRITSMEQGEIDGACGVFVSTLGAQFARQLETGQLRVVVQMGLSRHPAFPDAPNALDLAPDEGGRLALELLFAQLALGRPVLAPPGVPPERARALAEAFDKTMADLRFLEEARTAGLELRWFGAGRMKDVMEKMAHAPEPVKARVRALLAGKDAP